MPINVRHDAPIGPQAELAFRAGRGEQAEVFLERERQEDHRAASRELERDRLALSQRMFLANETFRLSEQKAVATRFRATRKDAKERDILNHQQALNELAARGKLRKELQDDAQDAQVGYLREQQKIAQARQIKLIELQGKAVTAKLKAGVEKYYRDEAAIKKSEMLSPEQQHAALQRRYNELSPDEKMMIENHTLDVLDAPPVTEVDGEKYDKVWDKAKGYWVNSEDGNAALDRKEKRIAAEATAKAKEEKIARDTAKAERAEAIRARGERWKNLTFRLGRADNEVDRLEAMRAKAAVTYTAAKDKLDQVIGGDDGAEKRIRASTRSKAWKTLTAIAKKKGEAWTKQQALQKEMEGFLADDETPSPDAGAEQARPPQEDQRERPYMRPSAAKMAPAVRKHLLRQSVSKEQFEEYYSRAETLAKKLTAAQKAPKMRRKNPNKANSKMIPVYNDEKIAELKRAIMELYEEMNEELRIAGHAS